MKILLVEDQPIAAMTAARMLSARGATVDIAQNGFEAIDKFINGPYAVVLMDIGLPDIDGIEVTYKIREIEMQKKSSKVPIIAITAHIDILDKELTIFDAVYRKPFSEKVIFNIVEMVRQQ